MARLLPTRLTVLGLAILAIVFLLDLSAWQRIKVSRIREPEIENVKLPMFSALPETAVEFQKIYGREPTKLELNAMRDITKRLQDEKPGFSASALSDLASFARAQAELSDGLAALQTYAARPDVTRGIIVGHSENGMFHFLVGKPLAISEIEDVFVKHNKSAIFFSCHSAEYLKSPGNVGEEGPLETSDALRKYENLYDKGSKKKVGTRGKFTTEPLSWLSAINISERLRTTIPVLEIKMALAGLELSNEQLAFLLENAPLQDNARRPLQLVLERHCVKGKLFFHVVGVSPRKTGTKTESPESQNWKQLMESESICQIAGTSTMSSVSNDGGLWTDCMLHIFARLPAKTIEICK